MACNTISLAEDLTALINTISDIDTQVKQSMHEAKQFSKKLKKLTEHYDKLMKKKKAKGNGSNRIKSGINKESPISKEMCDFLKVREGSLVARTEVTTAINKYIKANDLQKPENRRLIVLDKVLSKLLKLEEKIEITFFDLPKYMNFHFIKENS